MEKFFYIMVAGIASIFVFDAFTKKEADLSVVCKEGENLATRGYYKAVSNQGDTVSLRSFQDLAPGQKVHAQEHLLGLFFVPIQGN